MRRGKRHDGSTSRVCRFCGEVGARVVDAGGYVHRRCIGPVEKVQRAKTYKAMLKRQRAEGRSNG